MSKEVTAIVLAAGLGVRMQSKKPKILHAAAGRSMIEHVIVGLQGAGVSEIRIVIGHGGELVREHLKAYKGLKFFVQKTQAGTADAVKSADVASIRGPVLICNGDHPLISAADYRHTIQSFEDRGSDLLVVSVEVKNPLGFGRIVRATNGRIMKIVEEKDAGAHEKLIREINTGQYVVKAGLLDRLLSQIDNLNAKGEYYLTDIIKWGLKSGFKIDVSVQPLRVGHGVNTQGELARASKALYLRKARELLGEGVVIMDPAATYIDAGVKIGKGTQIQPGCFILGNTAIGEECLVEPYCQIKNAVIADRVEIRWGSLIEQSEVLTGALIGPYARLRPESYVGEGAHVGNFVELKKTRLGARAKANHLAYLGDAEIGDETNLGCGTITCNYATDKKKYKTVIGKRCFIGSDTQFVAPINIGDDVVIGSGSTITKDVPSGALAVARGRQVTKENYKKGKLK